MPFLSKCGAGSQATLEINSAKWEQNLVVGISTTLLKRESCICIISDGSVSNMLQASGQNDGKLNAHRKKEWKQISEWFIVLFIWKFEKLLSLFCLKPEQINRTKKNYRGGKKDILEIKIQGGKKPTKYGLFYLCDIWTPNKCQLSFGFQPSSTGSEKHGCNWALENFLKSPKHSPTQHQCAAFCDPSEFVTPNWPPLCFLLKVWF